MARISATIGPVTAHQNQTTLRVAGIAGTAVELLPAGTVTKRLSAFGASSASDSTSRPFATDASVIALTPGGSDFSLYTLGGVTQLALRVTSGGAIHVQRMAGSLTYEIIINLLWL